LLSEFDKFLLVKGLSEKVAPKMRKNLLLDHINMPNQFTITREGFDLINGSFTTDENGNISTSFNFSLWQGPLTNFKYDNDYITRFNSIIEIFEVINN
jgi:hypothetical protein